MKLTYEGEGRTVVIETQNDDLTYVELIELMDDMLKACGYIYEGHLDLVKDGE